MNDDTITYGEIRKKVEIKLSKAVGILATKDQTTKIRELAPKVAEGTMTYADALDEIESLERPF